MDLTCTSQLQSCTMCSYCTTKPSQLVNHVCTIHRHDPNFHVYCSYCMRSYRKLTAYRKHVSQGCKVPLTEDTTEERQSSLLSPLPDVSTCDAEESDDNDLSVGNQAISQRWHEARFILSIKEQYVTSQAAVDQVLASTTTLVSSILETITDDLKSMRFVSDS